MSTQESKSSSPKEAGQSAGATREGRQRWWLGRIEGAPILRHLSLWWKLVCIVAVLIVPTLVLLQVVVDRSSTEIGSERSWPSWGI
jgi:hypothetical protein